MLKHHAPWPGLLSKVLVSPVTTCRPALASERMLLLLLRCHLRRVKDGSQDIFIQNSEALQLCRRG